jgi:hypothetical protein
MAELIPTDPIANFQCSGPPSQFVGDSEDAPQIPPLTVGHDSSVPGKLPKGGALRTCKGGWEPIQAARTCNFCDLTYRRTPEKVDFPAFPTYTIVLFTGESSFL